MRMPLKNIPCILKKFKNLLMIVLFQIGRTSISFLIEKMCPAVIIVINARASKIITCEDNYDKDSVLKNCAANFSEKYGTYIKRYNGKDIPIFLSGMLTGQHAIDNESLRRFKWQFKFVLKSFSVCNLLRV